MVFEFISRRARDFHGVSMLKEYIATVIDSENFHQSAVNYFKGHDLVATVSGASFEDFAADKWPKGAGVYLIYQVEPYELLYIGMTGHVLVSESSMISIGGGCLSKRTLRWTPYCFRREGEYKDHWECGPAFKGLKKPLPSERKYMHHFPLSNIKVDCFVLNDCWRMMSPTFVESSMLQIYIDRHGRLPLGNQKL